nr:hypothetical protein [Cohnella nanjingensis]
MIEKSVKAEARMASRSGWRLGVKRSSHPEIASRSSRRSTVVTETGSTVRVDV